MNQTISGTVHKATNVRERVTYAYVTLDDGRKVDVVAFPNTQPTICRTLAMWNVNDRVNVTGNEQISEKSKYAIQFFPVETLSAGTENKLDDVDQWGTPNGDGKRCGFHRTHAGNCLDGNVRDCF